LIEDKLKSASKLYNMYKNTIPKVWHACFKDIFFKTSLKF